MNVNELRVLINERIDEVLTIAHDRYGFPGHEVETRFDLRGLAAGTALTTRAGRRILRFNLEACAGGEDSHGYRNTVPHEIAHLVVQWGWLSRDLRDLRLRKPQPHGSEWRSVCIALGGNGKRCAEWRSVCIALGGNGERIAAESYKGSNKITKGN